MMKRYLFFIPCCSFTIYVFLSLFAISIHASGDKTEQAIRQIEAQLYESFETSDVYVPRIFSFGGEINLRKLPDKGPVVSFITFDPDGAHLFQKYDMDKREAFKIYDLHLVSNKIYQSDLSLKYFYNDVISGKYTVYEAALNSAADRKKSLYGAFIYNGRTKEYHWANLGHPYMTEGNVLLDITILQNPVLQKNINEMLASCFQKEENQHLLNIENTKAIVIDSLLPLSYSWGFILYDGSSEYYMSPKDCVFQWEYFETPQEKDDKIIEAYTLYSIKDDLFPFLLQYLEALENEDR